MSISFTGRCLCGHIQYEGSVEQATAAICHCKNCQRHSGSAFSINLVVPMDTLTLDKAALSCYQDSADSGNPVYRYSCKQCHSVIISGNDALDGVGYLKAGTLDDSSFIKPILSIWECSAQSWVPTLEKVAHVDKNPPM